MTSSRRSVFPLFLAGGAAGLGLLMFGRRAQAAEVEEKIRSVVPSRGKKGGRKPLVHFTLVTVPWKTTKKGQQLTRVAVKETVPDLLAQASAALGRKIGLETFALATMAASEVPQDLGKAAVVHAALTYARRKGRGIVEILTSGDGHFGSQKGRYAATSKPPSAADIEIAEGVQGKRIGNPSPGAIKWDSPKTQDQKHDEGDPAHKSAASVAETRMRDEHLVAVALPGIPMNDLRLWRPA